MYEILFTRQANRALRKMSRHTARLIREKLDQLAQDPYARNPNVAKLQGRARLPVAGGDWRVIYELEDQRLVIMGLKVASRGGVY